MSFLFFSLLDNEDGDEKRELTSRYRWMYEREMLEGGRGMDGPCWERDFGDLWFAFVQIWLVLFIYLKVVLVSNL